jgi:hypothetical protein
LMRHRSQTVNAIARCDAIAGARPFRLAPQRIVHADKANCSGQRIGSAL